jgi:hypothetical protein
MTSNFNKLLNRYLTIHETTEHVAEPISNRAEIDLNFFADELIETLRSKNVFYDMEDYIDFSHFKSVKSSPSGDVAVFTWLGYKGKYTVKIKQDSSFFIVAIMCDEKLLDSPKGDNLPWESYIRNIAEFILQQEKQAEQERSKQDVGLNGEQAIELTSTQPSALPNAPTSS